MLSSFHNLTRAILPAWIYAQLIGNWDPNGFKKYFSNTGWIFLAKIISFVVSFFTIAAVARYLGPENFGRLSYAQSFVSIFSVLAGTGFDQVLYRDLVARPNEDKKILGTAFIAKLFLGSLTVGVTIATALVLNGNTILTWLIGIVTLTFIFQPFGVISQYFYAKVQAKYVSIVAISLSLLLSSLKLGIIFLNFGILYLAALIALEAALLAICYASIYRTILKQSFFDWEFSWPILYHLFLDSWPLMVASFSGYIYGRIDQIMIQEQLNSTAVGVYDAAVRLAEICGFFPGVFISSFYPAIINAKNRSRTEYLKRFNVLAAFSLLIAAMVSVIVFAAAPLLISVLYGSEFSESVTILRIYIWSLIGTISIGLIQSYLLSENMPRKILMYSILGATVNVGLNALFIPKYGIHGAAYTTLISYGIIIFLFIVFERSSWK